MSLPRWSPTRNWTSPQNFKSLTVNYLLNYEVYLAKHIFQIQDQYGQPIFTPDPAPMSHITTGFANAIIDPETEQSLEYCHIIRSDKHIPIWKQSSAKNLDVLRKVLGSATKEPNAPIPSAMPRYQWERKSLMEKLASYRMQKQEK